MKFVFIAVLAFFIAPSVGVALAISFTSVGDGWSQLNLPSWFVYAAFMSAASFVCAYWLAVRAGVTERYHKGLGLFAALLILITGSVAFISGAFASSAAPTASAAAPNAPFVMIEAFLDGLVPQLLQVCMGLSCFLFAATAIHMLMLTIKVYRSLTF